jgi:hypothetical protein
MPGDDRHQRCERDHMLDRVLPNNPDDRRGEQGGAEI